MTKIHALVTKTTTGEHAVSLVFVVRPDGATNIIACDVVPADQEQDLRSAVEALMRYAKRQHGGGTIRAFNESGQVL